jgi:uncharacterized protein YndB with AHSA1/START domain
MGDSREQAATGETSRDLGHFVALERTMSASAEEIFDAWVNRFDTWFSSPGELAMIPEVGRPYWFNVQHHGERYAHYGRFLALEAGRLIEQTWVSGRNGTDGAETILRIKFSPLVSRSQLRLTHSGFYDEATARNHGASWPQILEHLDATLMGGA